MSETSYQYFAFLAYSHQDNLSRRGEDAPGTPARLAWGDWLARALKTYRVPRAFHGRVNRWHDPVPPTLRPCYQDDQELPPQSYLPPAVEQALAASSHLVVICSPHSAHSAYVNAQVLYFKRLGRADRIQAFVVAGEPNASQHGFGHGVRSEHECFCPALRLAVRPDGTLDEHLPEPVAAVEARWGELKREVSAPALGVATPALEQAKLHLIAGLLGTGADDLVLHERQRELRRARWRVAWPILAALLLLAAVATTWGWRGLAEGERRQGASALAEAQQRQVAAERARLAAEGARDTARERNRLLAEKLFKAGDFVVSERQMVKPAPGEAIAFEVPVKEGYEYLLLAVDPSPAGLAGALEVTDEDGQSLLRLEKSGAVVFYRVLFHHTGTVRFTLTLLRAEGEEPLEIYFGQHQPPVPLPRATPTSLP